jgi:TPR repeat protein
MVRQNNLGFCYMEGSGVKQDYAKAAEWFRKSAAQGNKAAQDNLDLLKNEGKI